MGEAKRKNKKSGRSFQLSPQKSKFATIFIVVIILAVVGIDFIQRSKNSPLTYFDPNRSKGNVEAPLQIIEFVDFQCHECFKGAKILKSYSDKYPEAIHLTIKHFSLGQKNSVIGAIYAQCAANQEQFWPMHDLLFENQNNWRKMPGVEAYLDRFVAQLSLDGSAFQQCVQSNDVRILVNNEHSLGQAHFVQSTPAYFINEELVVGLITLEAYLKDYFEEQRGDLL